MLLPRKIKAAVGRAAKAVGAAVRRGLADVAEAMWLVASLGLWLHVFASGRPQHAPRPVRPDKKGAQPVTRRRAGPR